MNINSLYFIEDNFKEVKTVLTKNFELLQVWFYENHMVLNSGKCHNLILNKGIAKESIELRKNTLHAEALSALIEVAPFMTDVNN